MKANLPALGAGGQELLDEGTKLHDQLAAVDAQQEHSRLAKLPAAVRDFLGAKGMLYIGLKAVNDAAQELHADDPAAAARFNLKILCRTGARRRPGGAGGDAPTVTPGETTPNA